MQKLLNDLLTFAVTAFPEVTEAQISFLVEQVFSWPIAIGKSFPDFAITVDYDGVAESEFPDPTFHIRLVLRESKFRRVHSDYSQAFVTVTLVPCLYIRQRADAIHTRVIPEIDQHDATAQLPEAEWT